MIKNFKLKIKNYYSGQSLFEVVLALSVVSLIIFAVVILATNSIRNSDFSRDKTLATNYSQEGIEWLRGQRDADWTAFYGKSTPGTGTSYCFNSEPITVWPPTGLCSPSSFLAGTIFKREATLTSIKIFPPVATGAVVVTINAIEARVKVSWTDSQGYHEVSTVTDFSNFNAK